MRRFMCDGDGCGREGPETRATLSRRISNTLANKVDGEIVKTSRMKYMSSFRDLRELLLLAYCNKYILDTEFFLLYDSYTSKNPDFSYDTYPAFSLDDVPEAECKAEFRVLKQDLPRLREALRIPASFKLEQRSICDGMEGLCMLLRRVCYSC